MNEAENIVAFQRWSEHGIGDDVMIIANCGHEAKENYSIGMPENGIWKLRFNSDASIYSDDFANTASGDLDARQEERDGLAACAEITIAPYTVLIYSKDE